MEEGDTDGDFEGDPVGLSVSGLDPQDPNEVDVELPNAPDDMAVVPSTFTSTEPDPQPQHTPVRSQVSRYEQYFDKTKWRVNTEEQKLTVSV